MERNWQAGHYYSDLLAGRVDMNKILHKHCFQFLLVPF